MTDRLDFRAAAPAAPATTAGKVLRILLTAWFLMIAFNAVEDALGIVDPAARVRILDVGVEPSVYTWFSSLLLAGAAGMLQLIGRQAEPRAWMRRYWLGLSAVFLYLSADEIAGFHEMLTGPTKALLHLQAHGAFQFAWVIPYGLACLVGLAVVVPFLRALPRSAALWFVCAGAVYVGGAMGVEIAGGLIYSHAGTVADAAYQSNETLEEAMEGLGVLMFLHALSTYRLAHRLPARRQESPGVLMPAE